MIGIFDSGFGGLAIFKEILKRLPAYEYVYLGDNARTPYGTRSPETVYQFTKEGIDFLFAQGCELIILACNTASAEALRKLQNEYLPERYPGKRRVLGVIVPVLEEVIEHTKNRRVGVIATEGTVQSGTFPREMKIRDASIHIFQNAAPLLVPFVEAEEHRSPAARLMLRKYLMPLKRKGIDTLILGCTHYEYLASEVRRIMGKKVRVITEGPIVARKLAAYLDRHPEMVARLKKRRRITFFSTDRSSRFDRLGTLFFGKSVRTRRAVLGDL